MHDGYPYSTTNIYYIPLLKMKVLVLGSVIILITTK